MPWIGGARRAFLCWNRLRQCLDQADPDREAFIQRRLALDDELDLIFRIFPPRSIGRYLLFERELGSGGYGTVFLASATAEGLRRIPVLDAGTHYAVKRVRMPRRGPPEEVARSAVALPLERHLEVLDLMRDPVRTSEYFVRLYAFVAEVPRNHYQVMEFLEGPDLFDYLAGREETLPELRVGFIARQVFTAVDHLHRRLGAIHRDIKPENFGFARPLPPEGHPLPQLKLFDLGLSWILPEVIVEETAHNLLTLERAGTPLYMAPESWDCKFGPPSDVWSAGLVTYLLLSLELPFDLMTSRSPMEAIIRRPLGFASPCWSGISAEAREFLASVLQKDPKERATTTDALASSWLSRPGNGPGIRRSSTTPLPDRHSKREGSSNLWEAAASIAMLAQ